MIHEQPLCQEVKRNRSRVTDGEIFMETQRNTTRPGHLTTSLEVRETFINWNILFDGIQYYSIHMYTVLYVLKLGYGNHTKLQINGPSGDHSHADFYPPP